MRVSSERRRRDRELQRAAANRRVGHDMAYWILYGPALGVSLLLLALTVVGVVVWHKVPHATLAGWCGGAGIIILAAYVAWLVRTGSLHSRMMRQAKGVSSSGGAHMIGGAGALLVAAAALIWSQL